MSNYTNQVKLYSINATIKDNHFCFFVLAINTDWALTILNRTVDYDSIEVKKLSDVIGLASFGCRNVTGESPEEYLNYHSKPYK